MTDDGRPSGAAKHIYETLRTRILRGEYAGGKVLVEQELAKALDVSRTPVHEALQRLGMEGLVDVAPRRRARVAVVSATDIDQIYRLRMALESIAAESAAVNLNEGLLAEIVKENATMEAIVDGWTGSRMREFADANTRFHFAILAAARDRWLDKTLRPILDLTLGPLNSLVSKPASPEIPLVSLQRTCRQHREIIDALSAGAAQWAAAAMTVHVQGSRKEWGVNTAD